MALEKMELKKFPQPKIGIPDEPKIKKFPQPKIGNLKDDMLI